MDRLLERPQQASTADTLDSMLFENLRNASDSSVARAWLDAAIVLARSPAGCDHLRRILGGARKLARVHITESNRFRAAAAATVRGMAIDRRQILGVYATGAPRRKAEFLLGAASPDPRTKRTLFERYLADRSLAEDWIVASLEYFNHPAHATQTRPLLVPALEALPSLARSRKIFFVNRWLASFLRGQYFDEALTCTREFFRRTKLPREVELKVREAADELQRVVTIRQRWSSSPSGT